MDGKKVLQEIHEIEGKMTQAQKDAIIDYAQGILRNPHNSGLDLDPLEIDLEPIKVNIR